MGDERDFVSPFAFLQDWIPVASFVDDAAVGVFVLTQVHAHLAKFTKWEDQHTEKLDKPAQTKTNGIIDL